MAFNLLKLKLGMLVLRPDKTRALKNKTEMYHRSGRSKTKTASVESQEIHCSKYFDKEFLSWALPNPKSSTMWPSPRLNEKFCVGL